MTDPRAKLREDMLAAPDLADEAELPARFMEARDILRQSERMEHRHRRRTAAAVMLSETLPRMAHERGPEWLGGDAAKLAAHPRRPVPLTARAASGKHINRHLEVPARKTRPLTRLGAHPYPRTVLKALRARRDHKAPGAQVFEL